MFVFGLAERIWLFRHMMLDESDTTWEVYDINLAGCTLCGCMHVCHDGVCPVVKSKEGHNICTVTGVFYGVLALC